MILENGEKIVDAAEEAMTAEELESTIHAAGRQVGSPLPGLKSSQE